jgi:translin
LLALEAVLKKIKKDLLQKNEVREQAHEIMRKATSQSKQAILLIHQKKYADAEKLIESAKEKIGTLQDLAQQYPEIVYGGMFSAALQEYSEASIFLTLIKESRFITPADINVPSIDYVLGLADVIGEYRRLALDNLREGEVKNGEKCLEIMDQVFIELLALDEAYMLVPGLRHKSDAARRIIEATRGDVTIEIRRKSLENYLKKFEPTKTGSKQKKKKE